MSLLFQPSPPLFQPSSPPCANCGTTTVIAPAFEEDQPGLYAGYGREVRRPIREAQSVPIIPVDHER
jgi:hypothetical protein